MSFFKATENAIAERLKVKLADMSPNPRVYQSRDLVNIQDCSQGDITVFVTYTGLAGVNEMDSNAPHIVALTHEFVLWIVARGINPSQNKDSTKELADPLLERIVELLAGCRVVKGEKPLRLVDNGLGPAYSSEFGYFPLAFHHTKVIKGTT